MTEAAKDVLIAKLLGAMLQHDYPLSYPPETRKLMLEAAELVNGKIAAAERELMRPLIEVLQGKGRWPSAGGDGCAKAHMTDYDPYS